jgi:hypothetical protein
MAEENKELDQLIAVGEGQVLEFKKSDILADSIHLAKEMTAFANTLGGTILIGICDDGAYEGLKSDKGHETHVMNIARDRCEPPITPSFKKIITPKGDVYEIKVSRYRTYPHAVKTNNGKVYYIRVGTTVREASTMELGLLFESSREEVTKKPNLDLFLIDNQGNDVKSISAKPIYSKVKKVKVQKPYDPFMATFQATKNISMAMDYFTEKKPSLDLVPIRIGISNNGQAPAQEITVFIGFPDVCEIFNSHEVAGGVSLKPVNQNPTHGGLYLDKRDKLDANAWLDNLGNDLVMRNFEEIYVRFPEEAKEYTIKARLVQNYFPPKDFEFKIKIDPKVREVVEEVNEDKEL